MASATSLSNVDDCESCVLCSSKYNRIRPSFCQCKHCSIPLCMDCMKEHHEEVLQDVTQISHQYNELKELLEMKQKMIVDETTKSIEDVNQYFKMYINELLETQVKIILDIEKTKQDAQSYVLKIDSDLRIVGIEIQGLAKQSVAQTTKAKNLSTELKSIEQLIKKYQTIRTEKLLKIKPEFSIKFDCPSVDLEDSLQSLAIETIKTPPTNSIEASFDIIPLNMSQQPTTQQNTVNQLEKLNSSLDQDDNNYKKYAITKTTYIIDRMASDGENIMYTSYNDVGPDLIAYSCMDNVDRYRDWKQSRIDDMIWWGSIAKFICATENGIYSVDYVNGRFKITCVIRGRWSYYRVAANTADLFICINSTENNFNGIEVYSTQFEYIESIDFNLRQVGSFVDESSSFCMTDNIMASICTRIQNYREVFQVTFCDLEMNKLNSILLGKCDSPIEIRTDGRDRFFITTGHRQFYIVRSNGKKQKINLENDGNCIAVLDNRRVAISKERQDMEIIAY